MSAEILKRGRGPAKNRTELQEIEYTVSPHSNEIKGIRGAPRGLFLVGELFEILLSSSVDVWGTGRLTAGVIRWTC